MARLRPRIGEEDEGAVDGVIGEGGDEIARITAAEADVGQLLFVDGGEEFGDAVDEGLGAENADLRIAGGLAGEVFAAAEADLEPDFACAGKEAERGERALPGFRNGDARQEIVDEALLALRQRLAGGAALEAVAGLVVGHGRGEPRRAVGGNVPDPGTVVPREPT